MPTDLERCDALGKWVAARCKERIDPPNPKEMTKHIRRLADKILTSAGDEARVNIASDTDDDTERTESGSFLWLVRTLEMPDWPAT